MITQDWGGMGRMKEGRCREVHLYRKMKGQKLYTETKARRKGSANTRKAKWNERSKVFRCIWWEVLSETNMGLVGGKMVKEGRCTWP